MGTNRKKYSFTALIIVFLLAGLRVNAQQVHAYARLDTTAIMIGDQIGLTLGVDVPKDFQVQWPVLNDTLVSNLTVINPGKIDTLRKGNVLSLQRRMLVTSFDSGNFYISPFHFLFNDKLSQQKDSANTKELYLKVYSPQVDTTKVFKAIKGPESVPYTLGEILPWILLALLGIGVIILLIWYLKKRKNKQAVFTKKPKPLLPPGEEAIQKLQELRLSRLWQAGKLKDYHTAITDIMRSYIFRRYHVETLERTSDEIMEQLSQNLKNDEALQKAKEVFQLADLVKFAKLVPSALENDISLNYSLDFVNETKIVPNQDEQSTDKKMEEEK